MFDIVWVCFKCCKNGEFLCLVIYNIKDVFYIIMRVILCMVYEDIINDFFY